MAIPLYAAVADSANILKLDDDSAPYDVQRSDQTFIAYMVSSPFSVGAYGTLRHLSQQIKNEGGGNIGGSADRTRLTVSVYRDGQAAGEEIVRDLAQTDNPNQEFPLFATGSDFQIEVSAQIYEVGVAVGGHIELGSHEVTVTPRRSHR